MGMYEQKPGSDRAKIEAGMIGSGSIEEFHAALVLAKQWKKLVLVLVVTLLFIAGVWLSPLFIPLFS